MPLAFCAFVVYNKPRYFIMEIDKKISVINIFFY
jgi:hypothetical protein